MSRQDNTSARVDGIDRTVVSAEEWQRARAELLQREKEHTRAGDRLAAERRRAPWMKVQRSYTFGSSSGPLGLADLFEGRANGQALFFTGKLRIEGDMGLALRLQSLTDILK